jgi:UDP-N-acetylmuramyl pentapeptide phosphotransferase/UDP-N-acetylglucosamine-1-phosphate transferase
MQSMLPLVFMSVIGVVWATNLYNFMDGADGLAGGMGVMGFGAYMFAAALGDAPAMAQACAILSGACLGFLFFNFPPARIFMGDAGSIPLGFLSAALGLHGVLSRTWSWWFPLLVFSPFWVDASITLLKRVVRGEKIWLAHRQHYYQRLILSGWTHRQTAWAYYALMFSAGATGIYLTQQNQQVTDWGLRGWVVIYVALLCILEWRLGQNKNENR